MSPKYDPTELQKRLAIVEAQQQWINCILEAQGIKDSWCSLFGGAPLLGVGRDRIITEIERAEKLRTFSKKGDLVYGKHYRNIQDPEAERPTWQVHIAEFALVLAIPPDERKL